MNRADMQRKRERNLRQWNTTSSDKFILEDALYLKEMLINSRRLAKK